LYEQDPDSEVAPFVYATDVSVNGTYLKKKNAECVGSQGRGILMGHSGTFLLDNGDELHISESIKLVFCSLKSIEEAPFTLIQEREKAIFANDYLITGRLLGEGGYGKVLIGVDQTTQRQLACKMVQLEHLYEKPHMPNLRLPTGPREQQTKGGKKRWPTRVAACFREFDILKDLSHPNIVSIEKVFWSNNTIYLFQELVTGGDLFSFLEYKGGRLDNAQAAVVMRQVVLGIDYLHTQDIVHRDLKPDNILMTSLEDGARVVITDFGNARYLPNTDRDNTPRSAKYQRMYSYVGTLEYAAPEIHKANRTIPAEDGYSKSVDLWSIGTITATVLSGNFIFSNPTHPQYRDNPRLVIVSLAAQCDLSVLDDEHHPLWSQVGYIPKDFIKRLLVLDEDERMTATEALAHAWFANDCYGEKLEELYARSIETWQPRPANLQLVERITKPLPDLTAVGLPGQSTNQGTVSSYFHSPGQNLTQSITQTVSTSRDRHPHIPLLSRTDDYTNEKFLFASQVTPASCESNHAVCTSDQQCRTENVDQQQPRRFYSHYDTTQHSGFDRDTYEDIHEQDPAVSQGEQRVTRSNDYASVDEVEQGGSYGSTESLNNVNDVAYSQYPYHPCATSHMQEQPAQILVQETPPSVDDIDTDSTQEERYQQTQFPGGYYEGFVPADRRSSVLVNETPPEAYVT
jgi:serine/threonine protein kinase